MKILLTGMPGIGKSAVIESFVRRYPGSTCGILASEMLGGDGSRIGFRAVTPDGRSVVFAHSTLINSEVVVHGKYRVDVNTIDSFMVPEILKGSLDPRCVTVIDEIGRMQATSPAFISVVRATLGSSQGAILGSVVEHREPWANEFRSHARVVLVEVTEKNRAMLPELLVRMYVNLDAWHALSRPQERVVVKMLRGYFHDQRYDLVRKLVVNAIPYIAARWVGVHERGFMVRGFQDLHLVLPVAGTYHCDCQFFKAELMRGVQSLECSHVQAVRLFVAG